MQSSVIFSVQGWMNRVKDDPVTLHFNVGSQRECRCLECFEASSAA